MNAPLINILSYSKTLPNDKFVARFNIFLFLLTDACKPKTPIKVLGPSPIPCTFMMHVNGMLSVFVVFLREVNKVAVELIPTEFKTSKALKLVYIWIPNSQKSQAIL